MSKKVRLILLIFISIVLTFSIPFIVSIIPKKTPPVVDVDELNKNFQKTLDKALVAEREKTIQEMENAFKEQQKLENETMVGFAETFKEFYGEDTKNFKTSYTPDKLLWELSFETNEKGEPLRTDDTTNKGWNAYELKHKYEFNEKKTELKQEATIKVTKDINTKFNINDNKILYNYLGKMLGRELTEKDKNAINIKVNMNFDDLKSIDDLKTYIYDNEQLKIDEMIIETNLNEDKDKGLKSIEFKINYLKNIEEKEESEEQLED